MVKSEDKQSKLSEVLAGIEKNFGKGSIMRLGDKSDMEIERLSTGALPLDIALGGGLPKGRIVEVFGDTGSAKTTLSLHVIAEAQKLGGLCSFIDSEHAIDPNYAKNLGVDTDNLFISQPDCIALGELVLTRDGYVPIEDLESTVLNVASDQSITESYYQSFPKTTKFCYTLKTGQGSVIASAEHRFKQSASDYIRLGSISKGDFIEVPFMSIRDFFYEKDKSDSLTPDQATMLGFMLADGYYDSCSPQWTKVDPDLIKWFLDYISIYHPDCKVTQNKIGYRVSKKIRTSYQTSSFADFVHKYLGRVNRTEKYIPKEIFACSDSVRAALVRGMWSCDGTVLAKGHVQYDTISKNMAYNLSALLSSLGVIHKMYEKEDTRKSSYHRTYRIVVTSKEGVSTFREIIGLIGEKGEKLRNIDVSKKDSAYIFPPFVWNDVFSESERLGISLQEIKSGVAANGAVKPHGFNKKQGITLERLQRINQVLQSPILDEYLSLKTIYTKVIDVTPVGDLECLDIHVPEHNNFICQNLHTHNSGEAALDICLQLVESGEFSVIVVDSVAALVPRSELEGEMGDSHMGVMARLMSQAMRKLTGPISKSGCTVIFINQERDMIGGGGYGPRTTTCGGKALKFYASVRIDVTRIQTLKRGTDSYGIRVKANVIKNKTAPPMQVAEYDVIFGQGISTLGCIVDLAEELDIVTRRGAWYSYGEQGNVAQGRDKLIQWLIDNPDKCAEIEGMVKTMSEITKEDN